MTGLVIVGPQGIYPKVHATRLVDNAAQIAENCRLETGDLFPLNDHLQVVTNLAKGSPLTIFPITYNSTLYFLHWITSGVDAAYVNMEEDERGTIIITGDGEPQVTTEEMAIDGNDTNEGKQMFPTAFRKSAGHYPRAAYVLGVPAPNLKPVVLVSGEASGKKETRHYVTTWVNLWGEESAPSPVSEAAVGTEDQVYDVDFCQAPDGYTFNDFSVGYVRNMTPDGYVWLYPDEQERHFLKPGHKITISGTSGTWTAINGSWPVTKAVERTVRATHYQVTSSTSVRFYLEDITAFQLGDQVFIQMNEGLVVDGAGTGAVAVVNSVSAAGGFIAVTSAGETVGGKTPLTGLGFIAVARFAIPLVSAAASGTTGGDLTRVTPYNFGRSGFVMHKVRLYRQSGTDPNFYLIQEVEDSSATRIKSYADNKKTNKERRLSTEGWTMPPGNLKGVRANPHGYMMAFGGNKNKDLYLSAYQAYYAWPATKALNYRQASQFPILGVEVVAGAAVVLTKGPTYIGAGSHPQAFAMARRPHVYPCRSKNSIVSFINGVVYASDYGLILDGPGVPEPSVLTDAHHDKWTWDKDVKQQEVIGLYYRGAYIGFWTTNKGLILKDGQLTTHTQPATCAATDPETNKAYFCVADDVFEWEGDNNTFKTLQFKSKKFILPAPAMFLVYQVFGDFVKPRTATADTVTLKIYGEGTLIHTVSVANRNIGRLAITRRYREYELEVTCQSRVTHVYVNSNKLGLKQI